MAKKKFDIREKLKDICNNFHLLNGEQQEVLNLVLIQDDSIVVDAPQNMPETNNIKGYIQKISLELFYTIEGYITDELLPNQPPKTIRIKVDPDSIRSFDRRIYPRYVLQNPIETVVTSEDETEALLGDMINLSPAGLRVELPERIYLENRYTFSFDIEHKDIIYSLTLKGKPVSETMLSESFVYGVWLGTDKEDRKVVTEDDTEPDGLKTVELMTLVDCLIKNV